MPDYLPNENEFKSPIIETHESGKQMKMTKTEMARANNGAYANICENTKDYKYSGWQHFLCFA